MLEQDRSAGSSGRRKALDTKSGRERRSHERHKALLRVAVLHAGSSRDLCVVRNISRNGLSARAYRRLSKGEQVRIEFKSGETVGGSVVWERDWDVGIAFPAPIDVEAILASRWITDPSKRRNLPRIAIACPGRVKTPLRSCDVSLHDISQAGARVETNAPAAVAGEVMLSLPGLMPIAGVIRWARGTELGISFNQCLPFEPLARWIQTRRGSKAA
jgi:hypothetical protein